MYLLNHPMNMLQGLHNSHNVSLVELNAWEDEICDFKNFITKKNEKKK